MTRPALARRAPGGGNWRPDENCSAENDGTWKENTPSKVGGAANAAGWGDISYTKGAPDVVLRRCTKIYLNGSVQPLTDAKRVRINAVLGEMSSQALQVLAHEILVMSHRMLGKQG